MNSSLSNTNKHWKSFYKGAGCLAILIVVAGLVDAITSMGVQARENSTVPIMEWFTLFQTHRFEAFSRLGLINIITVSLSIPIYLALANSLRGIHPVRATLAPVILFMGAAIYLSSNTVFPLFAVSRQFAVATEAQKPLLVATGRSLLAQGADLTSGTFFGLVFVQVAGLLITSVMLRGEVFSKWTGIVGMAGYIAMVAFFIMTAFFPQNYDLAMIVSAPGGLLLLAYQIMIAARFFQLGKRL